MVPLSSSDPCPVCQGEASDLASSKIHFDTRILSANIRYNYVLQTPVGGIIEKAFTQDPALGNLSERAKIIEPLIREQILESDGCYRRMIEMMNCVLDPFKLNAHQISSITKVLERFLRRDHMSQIGHLQIPKGYLTDKLSDLPDKDKIFAALAESLGSFSYPSLGRIDGCFNKIYQMVLETLGSTWSDTNRITIQIVPCVTKGIEDGLGMFPSHSILEANMDAFLTPREVDRIATEFGGIKFRFFKCKDQDARLSMLSVWIEESILPVEINKEVLSRIAESLYSAYKLEDSSGTIHFPPNKELMEFLFELRYCVSLSRQDLAKLLGLADKAFTYPPRENPKLRKHLALYTQKTLKPFPLNETTVTKIVEVMRKISI
jgi:hypothetical protein